MIANLSSGPVTGAPGIVVHVPVLNDGEVKYVLNAIFYPAPLTELLLQQKLPPSWFGTIIDRNQRNQITVARTRNFDKLFGKSATPTFAAQANQYQESTWRGVTLDGEEVFAALHRSDFTGWTVGLAITAEEFDALLRNSRLITGAGGLARPFRNSMAACASATKERVWVSIQEIGVTSRWRSYRRERLQQRLNVYADDYSGCRGVEQTRLSKH